MLPARIAELLRPFLASSEENGCHSEPAHSGGEEPAVLSPELLQHISMYIDILMRWNARINLTAIRDEEEIVTRHFGESLFAARELFPEKDHVGTLERGSAGRDAIRVNRGRAALQGRVTAPKETGALAPEVADLGSGAGFPGIPLKLWAPDIKLTLIESNHKKATFLREVVRALTLTDVNILSARAETLPPATFSLVTLRAVERFEAILPVAGRLVASGGRLALLVGREQAHTAQKSLAGLRWQASVDIPGSRARILLIGSK